MPPNLPRNFGRLQFGGQGLALHFCHKSLNAVPRRLRNPFATPAQLLSAERAPHDGCATLRNSRATPQRCHDGCATLRNSCATPAQLLSAERAPHDSCATLRSSCATPHGDDGMSKLRVVVRERSLSPQAHTGVTWLHRTGDTQHTHAHARPRSTPARRARQPDDNTQHEHDGTKHSGRLPGDTSLTRSAQIPAISLEVGA